MEVCPLCTSDLTGEPIPDKHFVHHLESDPEWDRKINMSCEEQHRQWGRCHCLPYGEKAPEDRFYQRKIGIEIRGVYDGVLLWQCPDCGGRWHRWPEGHELRRRAEQYMTADA